MTWRPLLLSALFLTVLGRFGAAPAADGIGDWPFYGGDNGAKRYSPLEQINRDNVSTLRIAWRRPQLDPAIAALLPANFRLSNNFRSTPIMVRGVLYASNGIGLTEAFDPENGKTLWVQKPGGPGGPGGEDVSGGTSNRGVAYWSGGPGGTAERLFTHRGHSLFALNPKTG